MNYRTPIRQLRSNERTNSLHIPFTVTLVTACAFSSSASRLCNNLPPHMTNSRSSVNLFKSHLISSIQCCIQLALCIGKVRFRWSCYIQIYKPRSNTNNCNNSLCWASTWKSEEPPVWIVFTFCDFHWHYSQQIRVLKFVYYLVPFVMNLRLLFI